MDIEFDEEKRRQTLQHRGLDFADAARLFQMRTIVHIDDRAQYGEVRFQSIGFLDERLTMVVWTQRGTTCRIISMRKCNAREQRRYGKQLG